MSSSVEDRQEKIKQIVCEILEIDPDEVTETSLFAEDHDADSLRAIEILAALEKQLGILIDQQELVRMVNLRGINAVVDGVLAAR
ncbi:polyketide-8 synthase acyl carrier protein [Lentzea guizhouensis]|uniref:Polyketide-8 synthase acyl carrier protein n=1 Tax=Lentzea guizhouensis TaxID=1586287 RepID=A0A1B2HPT0_9PSEU|nr:polyketide-8 synthase acyl carrier protein [Lentzea guizhouensis]